MSWGWEEVGNSTGQLTTQRIAVKEMIPVVVACAVRGPYWQHLQVLVRSDNMAVVHG